MLEVFNTLLTGSINIDSDTDGNVSIIQNKQEIKLTPSQAKELEDYLSETSSGRFAERIKLVKLKESIDV